MLKRMLASYQRGEEIYGVPIRRSLGIASSREQRKNTRYCPTSMTEDRPSLLNELAPDVARNVSQRVKPSKRSYRPHSDDTVGVAGIC